MIFIEVDTIRNKGDVIYYNILIDNYEPRGIHSELSSLGRHEMNCKTKQYLILRTVGFKNSMGKGKIIGEKDYRNLNFRRFVPLKGGMVFLQYK